MKGKRSSETPLVLNGEGRRKEYINVVGASKVSIVDPIAMIHVAKKSSNYPRAGQISPLLQVFWGKVWCTLN